MTVYNLIHLRIREFWLLFRLLVARVIVFFYPKQKGVWLISERGKEARDNGYFFYKWLKKNHPEISAKYIISKDSVDYSRIEPCDIIEYNSFKQCLYIWRAEYLISTHIMGYTPDHVFFAKADSMFHFFQNKKKIFLQHGIIKDRLESLFYGKIDIDLFVCGSNLEYQYIKENFGFPSGIVQYTGLCRYDNLYHFDAKQQILIMPTFRIYIDRAHFEESEYYNAYKNLLTNTLFHSLLEKYDYQAVFYPHFEFQSKISLFQKLSLSPRITIADMNYDVQQLLKESSLLITDFSSVFFDMMYMNKPIIFYQFDEAKYRAGHYKEGYLNYRDVGPVTNDLTSLLSQVQAYLSGEETSKSYQGYYDETFAKRDTENCHRVYEAIRGIADK